MPSFDLLVIGTGGGPAETNLSGYLLKPYSSSWEAGLIGIEGGSGLGALSRLLEDQPGFLEQFPSLSTSVSEPMIKAAQIYSYLRCYLISHAHLDHVAALILSSGSTSGPRKSIYAPIGVLADLETIFAGRIWPSLATWDCDSPSFMYQFRSLEAASYTAIMDGISVFYMPISHGPNPSPGGTYDSAAFFIRSDESGKEFLFFGDVEPDSLSRNPRTRAVWKHAAHMIPERLDTIFLECSYVSSRPVSELYGHLSPPHVMAELLVLASIVAGQTDAVSPGVDVQGVLSGVRVVVIHCKERMQDCQETRPIRETIVAELEILEAKEKLGISILAAAPGMRFEI